MEEKDYKKLYEDVVALAKDGLKDGLYLSRSAKDVTEFLFPQLKETKDEKMRRELTRFLIDFNNGYYSRPSETKIDSWIKWIDEKCEQKPTDKVEPKFKVGDWIVQENVGIYQVIEICESWYEVIDVKDNHYSISFDKEYMCHLWTIQDAKDGDVLYSPCCKLLWIYKDEKTCHIGSNLNYTPCSIVCNTHICIPNDAQPATKEQRDFLFQKMKETGYEWDAEKKELNKIEKQGEKTEPIDGFNTEFERQISHLIASTINKEYDYTKDFVKWTSDTLLNYAKHELEKQGRQKSQCKSAFELWKDMRFEVYMQASGNRHEPNCSDDSTKMFSINDIDEIFEKVAEKQGEQKVINEYNEHEPTSYEIEKWNEAYEKGYDIGYMNGKNEQKQVEWSFPYNVNETIDKLIAIAECLEMDGDCLFNGYTGTECGKFLRDLARKQVECKSAEWSEEDEKKMNKLVSLCTNFKNGNTQLHSVYLEFQELIDWLKSIKDRVQPQPKQEWSEDDEKMLLQIINEMEAIKSNSSTIFEKNIAQDKIDWLKSIRSRHITYELDAPLGYDKDMNPIYPPINHWRPSPEQMQAVFDASERNDKLGSVLRNLYDDLRKL